MAARDCSGVQILRKQGQRNLVYGLLLSQKDMLFPHLTVEETLMFSAKLRLDVWNLELRSRVKSLIQELGLEHVVKTRVGSDVIRGISGRERRRVSIGVDVIHDPKVLFLDEPTSGLDSTSALQIISMLKTMAETRGRTIILNIHQRGFRIVKLFNLVLLLANGTGLHHGTVDRLGSGLGLMGLELPPHCNVIEFAIDALETIQEEDQQHQNSVSVSESPAALALWRNTLQQLFQQSKVADEESAFLGVDLEIHRFSNSRRCREILILSQRFSKVLVDAPDMVRGQMNLKRLSLTDITVKELFACKTL